MIPREFTVQYDKNKVKYNTRPKYLYRGIHGDMAEDFIHDGKLVDYGYMAFSRHRDVANSFGRNKAKTQYHGKMFGNEFNEYQGYPRLENVLTNDNNTPRHGITLRVSVDSIPKGTPWLWFNPSEKRKERNVHQSKIDEGEVLLPPGTLKILDQKNFNALLNGTKKYIDVTYTQNKRATTIKGKSLYRK